MNHLYRIVWNEITRTWVAVTGIANARGKPSRAAASSAQAGPHARERTYLATRIKILTASLALVGAPAHAFDTNALPTSGKVTAGSATVSQVGNTLNIQQTTQRAALDWQSFNIGAAASVNFKQPGASAVALNRIVGNEASQIYGKLNANGLVFFTNPNGMLFARGAQIDVGGILATTMSLGNKDFIAGNYQFTNPGAGTIRNDGIINALGSAVLIGNNVHNAGKIVAATVTLAAGNTVALDLVGDGLIRARFIDPALKADIENSGTIDATVAVTMTAGQASGALVHVVNDGGFIRATGLTIKGGEIVLEGGKVENVGTISTSNANNGGRIELTGLQARNSGTLEANGVTSQGGRIDVSAVQRIDLTDRSSIQANGAKGGSIFLITRMKDRVSGDLIARGELSARGDGSKGSGGFIETSAARIDLNGVIVKTSGGQWLIDPIDFTIGSGNGGFTSNSIGAGALSSALGSGAVTIATSAATAGNGDISVNAPVSWNANTILTLSAHRNINVNSNITATGDTAGLNLFYGGTNGVTAPANGTGYSVNNGASIILSGSNPSLSIGNAAHTPARAINDTATKTANTVTKTANAASPSDAAARAADAAARAADAAARAADAAAKAADAAAKATADATAKTADAAARAAAKAKAAAITAADAAAKTTDAAAKAVADTAAKAADAEAIAADAAAKAAAAAAKTADTAAKESAIAAAKAADAAAKAADASAKATAAAAKTADTAAKAIANAAAKTADAAARSADAAARATADAAAKTAAKTADVAAKAAADAAAKVTDAGAARAAAKTADAAAKAADAAARAAADAAARTTDPTARTAADAIAKTAADAAAKTAVAAAKAMADATAKTADAAAADTTAKTADAAARTADAAAIATAHAAAKTADAVAKVADAAAKIADAAAARTADPSLDAAAEAAVKAAAQAALVRSVVPITTLTVAGGTDSVNAPAAEGGPSSRPITSDAGASSGTATAQADASRIHVSSGDAEDKVEDMPVAKPIVTTVVIADTIVQKPAEQILQLERPKGRMLVCR